MAQMVMAILFLGMLTGCSRSWSNFSQYPGFSQYYAQYPRNPLPATDDEQALLTRFRPRLFVDKTAEGLISFYRDYIAQGVLNDATGARLSTQVGRQQLNLYRTRTDVVFVHQPQPIPATPEVFARIDYDQHPVLGQLSFLTYHFVFRNSGIAAGLLRWQEWLLSLVADPSDWHQLDHYTAATIVLDSTKTAIALILQQHNHEHSYVLGADLPYTNDRISLVAAVRSNELYPWHSGAEKHPVVRFLSQDTLPYLVTGLNKPWLAGSDLSKTERRVDYALRFIPATDAFYSFAGYLGQRRRMAGRDAPPGADYNTPPRFKRPLIRLVAFNWQEGDTEQMNSLIEFFADSRTDQPPFTRLLDRFNHKLALAHAVRQLSNKPFPVFTANP